LFVRCALTEGKEKEGPEEGEEGQTDQPEGFACLIFSRKSSESAGCAGRMG